MGQPGSLTWARQSRTTLSNPAVASRLVVAGWNWALYT